MITIIYGTMIVIGFGLGFMKGIIVMNESKINYSKTENPIKYFLGIDD